MQSGVENLVLLGSGESLNTTAPEIVNNPLLRTLALQRVFPYCHKLFNIVPDYWSWFDANGSIEGLRYIVENAHSIDFRKMEILVPHFICESYGYYREYAGTTPLGKNPQDWDLKYRKLLNQVREIIKVEEIVSTTTKNLVYNAHSNREFMGYDLHGADAYVRFMSDKILYGTVPFDSETVMGTTYKWGLESKLSSVMLPLAYYLKAKNVYVSGVDFVGGRFYDTSKARHAWGEDVEELNPTVAYALSLIAKWAKWTDLHGMKIMTLAPKEISLLATVLPVVRTRDII